MNAGHDVDLLRCRLCGWVHFALSEADILPGTDPARVRRCFRCHAPISELEPCSEEESGAPRGVTLQGVIWP
jgi:hypothetical protein